MTKAWRVAQEFVLVRVVRFPAFPVFMLVPMMSVVNMQMFLFHGLARVFEFCFFTCRPEPVQENAHARFRTAC